MLIIGAYTVRNCVHPSKCRKCQNGDRFKHAAALHEYYVKPNASVNIGAAEVASFVPESSFAPGANDDQNVVVSRKINSGEKRVVGLPLRTCAML